MAEAFNHAVPVAGGWVVAFCAFLFGYTTLIGWSYYGEVCLEYIFGPRVVVPYRWIYCGLIVLGATSKVDLVWAWGDLMNGLQIFPNLVGVVGPLGRRGPASCGEDEARGAGRGRRRRTGVERIRAGRGASSRCDGVSLEDAAREHGTPLYVYSRAGDRGGLPGLREGLRAACRTASATR